MENLILLVYFDDSLCHTHKIMSAVLSLLNSSPTHLRCLTFDIFLELSWKSVSSSSDIRNSPEWETLDALFSNASNGLPDFAKLEIRISIILEDSYVRYSDLSEQKEIENIAQTELTDLFKFCLPATNRAGRLFITLRTIRPAPWAYLYNRWDVKAGTVLPACMRN